MTKCPLNDYKQCDFSGEVPMTTEIQAIADAYKRGNVPEGTRTLDTSKGWRSNPVTVHISNPSNDGWVRQQFEQSGWKGKGQ